MISSGALVMWKKLYRHLSHFWYVWALLFVLLIVGHILRFFPELWTAGRIIIGLSIVLITLLFLIEPLNAVYGLMGTTGSISLLFLNFLVITFVFAGIYHLVFFRHSGVSYDVNQPHIAFDMYANGEARTPKQVSVDPVVEVYIEERIKGDDIVRDTVFVKKILEQDLNYQPINYWYTWRNTLLTTLMQEPADFFATAATYNNTIGTETEQKLNRQKASWFQGILIIQILISWIFFGVFISILYNKFRYES